MIISLPVLMLLIGTENSPMKSLEDVESKSFTENRIMANSGQVSVNLKLSFHTGLKPKICCLAFI